MATNKKVVARLTAIRAVGVRTIIEVHSDATFSGFYHYFMQDGLKWSTKEHIRCANRNEGLKPWHRAYRLQPGLEAIAEHLKTMPQFASIKIRIIRKRAYRKLLDAAPDVLGVVRTQRQPDPRLMPKPVLRYPVRFPDGYLPIKKRVSILTGRG